MKGKKQGKCSLYATIINYSLKISPAGNYTDTEIILEKIIETLSEKYFIHHS
jgi:hypothetical protein